MDMGRFLIETHLRTRRSIKELAASHEVSASWLFKLLRRYRLSQLDVDLVWAGLAVMAGGQSRPRLRAKAPPQPLP
jgi:hypothetical protein